MRCDLCKTKMQINNQQGNTIEWKCPKCGRTMSQATTTIFEDNNSDMLPRSGEETDQLISEL